MDSSKIVPVLAFASTRRVGRKTVAAAIDMFASAKVNNTKSLQDLVADLERTLSRFRTPALGDLERGWETANRVVGDCEKLGITILPAFDEKFPASLGTIPDPCSLLFIKGSVPLLADPKQVAVVGAREASPYAIECAERISTYLLDQGWSIVAGLAKGVDTAAHRAALVNGRTVAFLAHGLDSVYPSQNRELADVILETGGVLASEYPPGTPARRSHFVERDRLQSGLSKGVVVVETSVDGGTMKTAGFALEQKRLLAVVMPGERKESTAGNFELLDRCGLATSSNPINIQSMVLPDCEPKSLTVLQKRLEIQVNFVYPEPYPERNAVQDASDKRLAADEEYGSTDDSGHQP